MAGLFAAIALRAAGFEIAIYERAGTELASRGAGIATHDELYAALRAAGIELRDEMGVRSAGRMVLGTDGAVVGTLDMPQIMTSWGLMYRFLRAQIPAEHYHNGRTCVAVEQSSHSVTARFNDGGTAQGDWLIAADGARSTVHELLAPEISFDYCGYFAWRGLFDERLIPPAVLDELAYRLTFCMAPGGHWLGYLVAGPDDDVTPGKRWFNWGWYRTADRSALRTHLTDAEGVYHEHGIPHHRLRADLIAAMRAEAQAYLAPQAQQIIYATPQAFIQGIYERSCQRMYYDRVFVIGDAAFTARPHIGLGVSKAAEDAATLVAALKATGREAALARWNEQRCKFGHAIIAHARRLGSYIGPPPSDSAGRALAAYHQRPDVLMAQTAPTAPLSYL